MRYLTIVGAVALAACLGMAEAAVETVKVGGDIQIRGIARDNWDLDDKAQTPGDGENWYDSTVRLRVDVEFTHDVGAVIRLINERDWGMERTITLNIYDGEWLPVPTTDRGDDVELDLGYITLDNMFGYPVKATLGRQEILFGEGFLIGDGYNPTVAAEDKIAYGKSIRRAFDALRATYSAEPYTVDLFTAKIDDDATGREGDADLSGLNIRYNYLDMATFDLGYFVIKDRDEDFDATAISLRGEGDILIQGAPGLTVKGEYVWQSGDVREEDVEEDLDAKGWYLGAEYAFQDVVYDPFFGVTYIFMSGDDPISADVEEFGSLDDKEFGVIGELSGLTTTNLKAWKLAAGLEPIEALSLDVAYYLFERDEPETVGADADLGDEINVTLTYDYTEDVQFGLQAAWFKPGDYFKGTHDGVTLNTAPPTRDDTATQIVGSVKVSF